MSDNSKPPQIQNKDGERMLMNAKNELSKMGAELLLIYDSIPDPKSFPSGYRLSYCSFDDSGCVYVVKLVREKGNYDQVSPDWSAPKSIMRRVFVITESFRNGGGRHREHASCAYFDSDGRRITPEQAQVISDSLIQEPDSQSDYARRWIFDEQDAHRNGGDPLRVTEGRIIDNGKSPIESDPFLAIIAKEISAQQLLHLIESWRATIKMITECADSNEKRGDHNAARQNRAQAIGVHVCAEELDALMRPCVEVSRAAFVRPCPIPNSP